MNVLPWKYGISLHITAPNINVRNTCPTNVNGIQNTPSNRSERACKEKKKRKNIIYTKN